MRDMKMFRCVALVLMGIACIYGQNVTPKPSFVAIDANDRGVREAALFAFGPNNQTEREIVIRKSKMSSDGHKYKLQVYVHKYSECPANYSNTHLRTEYGCRSTKICDSHVDRHNSTHPFKRNFQFCQKLKVSDLPEYENFVAIDANDRGVSEAALFTFGIHKRKETEIEITDSEVSKDGKTYKLTAHIHNPVECPAPDQPIAGVISWTDNGCRRTSSCFATVIRHNSTHPFKSDDHRCNG